MDTMPTPQPPMSERASPSQPLRAMGPYVLALLAGLVLVAAVPAISIAFL